MTVRPLESLGAPSPLEAWAPPDAPPSLRRETRQFLGWVRAMWRQTDAENPVFLKSSRLAYVRRRWPFHGIYSDLVFGLGFGALALILIAILAAIQDRKIPASFPLQIFNATAGVFLCSTLFGGIMQGRRVSGFIKSTDKALAWDDLALTPLREEQFLWAWLWAPILERARHAPLAALFGVFGIMIQPLDLPIMRAAFGGWTPQVHETPGYLTFGNLLMIGLGILMIGLAGAVISAGMAALSICLSLNIGARLHDPLDMLWGFVHVLPLAAAHCLNLTAVIYLLTTVMGEKLHGAAVIAFSLSAAITGAFGSWMILQYLLEEFWPAVLARRHVKMQVSWWRSLFARPKI